MTVACAVLCAGIGDGGHGGSMYDTGVLLSWERVVGQRELSFNWGSGKRIEAFL